MDLLLKNLDHADAETRAVARIKLVELGAASVPPLVAQLDTAGTNGRREAALALAELGAREAVPRLLEAWRAEPYDVAAWVARALGQLGD